MVLRLALPLAAAAALVLLLLPIPAGAVKNRPPHWMDLATSGTGAVVLGAAYEDGVYLSKDSGRTFTRAPIPSDCKLCGPSASTRDDGCQYASVAISSNGNLLFAAAVHDGCVCPYAPIDRADRVWVDRLD